MHQTGTLSRGSSLFLQLAVMSAAFVCSSAHAQSSEIANLETLPTEISYVETGGFWSKGQDEGFFRVVVTSAGIEHVSNRLFIQMLQLNNKTQTYKIVKTIGIGETNRAEGNVINVSTSFGDINAFEVKVESSNRGQETKRFMLILNGSGGYKFKRQN